MNQKKYFLLSLLLSTSLSLKATNKANPKRPMLNNIVRAETGTEAMLEFNEKDSKLIMSNPNEAFAYIPVDTRVFLLNMSQELMLSEDIVKHLREYSVIHYDSIHAIMTKTVSDAIEKNSMLPATLGNLNEYKKALDNGDALIFPEESSVNRGKVSAVCNLLVKKKIKANEIYTNSLYINGQQITNGATGPAGAAGAKGATGPAGAAGATGTFATCSTISAANGTVKAPAYSFCSGPASGIYFVPGVPAAGTTPATLDTLALSASGVSMLQTSDTGAVVTTVAGTTTLTSGLMLYTGIIGLKASDTLPTNTKPLNIDTSTGYIYFQY